MKSDFFGLIERLAQSEVDFVIVGGFAGVVYGCTYVTQDIDICCDFTAENLFRLQKALCGINPVHRMTPKRPKFEITEKNSDSFNNLYLDTDIGQLDCLSFIDGIGDYQNVEKESVLIDADGVHLKVLSLDSLIKAKKAMKRPRDREAIMQLESIKKLQD
jgi:predicted nucleotidyltransferase